MLTSMGLTRATCISTRIPTSHVDISRVDTSGMFNGVDTSGMYLNYDTHLMLMSMGLTLATLSQLGYPPLMLTSMGLTLAACISTRMSLGFCMLGIRLDVDSENSSFPTNKALWSIV